MTNFVARKAGAESPTSCVAAEDPKPARMICQTRLNTKMMRVDGTKISHLAAVCLWGCNNRAGREPARGATHSLQRRKSGCSTFSCGIRCLFHPPTFGHKAHAMPRGHLT